MAQELKAGICPWRKLTILDPSVGPAAPTDTLADLKAISGWGAA